MTSRLERLPALRPRDHHRRCAIDRQRESGRAVEMLGLDDRATSTTLDVTLCLLLVSAAVALLATASPPPDDHDAATVEHAADRIATTTLTITYPVERSQHATADATDADDVDTEPGDGESRGHRSTRTVHGTPASLLARSAVANLHDTEGSASATFGGLGDDDVYERAVRNRTAIVLADVSGAVNVTATYAPVANATAGTPLGVQEGGHRGVVGTTSVGPEPPSDVDVSVVRIRVPVGTGSGAIDRALASAAADDGFAGVARVAAEATVRTLLPPPRTYWGARDPTTDATVGARYQTLAASLDVDVVDALEAGDLAAARRTLERALAARYETNLETRYDSPTAAATSVDPTVVTVVVRTWSP